MNARAVTLVLLLPALAARGLAEDRAKAEQLFRDGKYSEAVELFAAAVSAAPDDVALRYNLALCAWRAGQQEVAERAAERVVADGDARLRGMGRALLGALRYDRARALVDEDAGAALEQAESACDHLVAASAAPGIGAEVLRNAERALRLKAELEALRDEQRGDEPPDAEPEASDPSDTDASEADKSEAGEAGEEGRDKGQKDPSGGGEEPPPPEQNQGTAPPEQGGDPERPQPGAPQDPSPSPPGEPPTEPEAKPPGESQPESQPETPSQSAPGEAEPQPPAGSDAVFSNGEDPGNSEPDAAKGEELNGKPPDLDSLQPTDGAPEGTETPPAEVRPMQLSNEQRKDLLERLRRHALTREQMLQRLRSTRQGGKRDW